MGIEERVVPDYVVRMKYVEKDLGRLLRALGCTGGKGF